MHRRKTEELVAEYQQEKREDLLQEIIQRNKGLLYVWARAYGNIPYWEEEDLLEEGLVALWKAVQTYSSDRDVAFTTYLKSVVKQHYNRIYYTETRKKRFAGVEPASLEEIQRDKAIEIHVAEEIAVQEFIGSLEGRLQEVAVYLAQGYSKADTARLLDIKPSSISFHCKRLQRLITEYFDLEQIKRKATGKPVALQGCLRPERKLGSF